MITLGFPIPSSLMTPAFYLRLIKRVRQKGQVTAACKDRT